ncbi:MAG: hypothetical protein J3K34DRAFT_445072 [Monoraphidium minutum]|nr:MAG: hypothetical protein J3K34DRAFT_445072 [Monoraphidium minutum]
MASELSTFIERELKNKGFSNYDDDPEADNPHQSLMGALRVEARVKEAEAQKKLFTIKRAVCVGGGIALVVVMALLLVSGSRRASGTGAAHAAPARRAPHAAGSQGPMTTRRGTAR